MENKKNNGLVIAFIIVLIVAVIGIGGTIYFYNKSLNNNEIKNQGETGINKENNEGETETKNEDKITIDQLKNRYEGVVAPIGGQFTPTYYRIMDKQENKIIIDNLEEMGAISLYFVISNNKGYIYTETKVPDLVFNSRARLYDLNGNLIFNILNTQHFALITKNDIPYAGESPVYIEEIEGAYYAKDDVIGKYSLDGTLLSSSKKFDEILAVGQKYSLIYNKSDNSSYVVSNDDSYSMKIVDGKLSEVSYISYNENAKEVRVYYFTDTFQYYSLNLKNNKITTGSD